MKRFFRKLHLWLSIPFGIIVTLVCFSGAMLVFEEEVVKLTQSDLLYVEKVGEKPLPMGKLAENVSATLPDSVKVTGITASSDPQAAYKANLSKPRRAVVYVDQYTGEVKGRYQRPAFFTTMFKLHRWLLDSANPNGGIFWGKVVVGTSTIVFVIVLLTGIVLWWPRTRKALVEGLKIVTGRSRFRFWYCLHTAGGMYVLVLLLAMALTGLTWSFSWYRTGFYALFGVETQQNPGGHGEQAGRQQGDRKGQNRYGRSNKPEGEKGQGRERKGKHRDGEGKHDRNEPASNHTFACWQQVYETLRAENPGYEQITVSDGSATVSNGSLGNSRASDRYTFDTTTGKVTDVARYADAASSGKIRGWIYSVHTGSWGGTLTRVLWFLAALLGASLPLTGYYLWIKRLYRKRKTS